MRFTSVTALSVLLPANQVAAIAARSDAQSISPNRLTARTGASMTPSVTERVSGIGSARTRTTANSLSYVGLDGAGIGIAVLDSSVMWKHQHMMDHQSQTRVRRAIDFLKVGDAAAVGVKDWTPGIDVTSTMYPGGLARHSFEKTLDNTTALYVDAHGHGTHVAAIAAGRDHNSGGFTEATGIGPGAHIYDVKVLDGKGYGQVFDVLAGIDWVIYHARQYNIRVMNLSLAADATESWQTDPLARAARSAVAAGITVVVAAGNFGQSAAGGEVFGTISSPGHDPSVITVGSSNMMGTVARSDDVVNFVSSRGPTRGSMVDAAGLRRVDNLLKPDLVAPRQQDGGCAGHRQRLDDPARAPAEDLPAAHQRARCEPAAVHFADDA